MANLFFDSFRNNLFKADIADAVDFSTDTIKAVLIDTGAYTPSAAHDFLNDVPALARIGTPQTLSSKTVGTLGAGIFDAADITFPAVSGASAEAILLWKDTGVESTSSLIALIDQVTSGLPVTPNATNIVIVWSNTIGIVKIG